MHAAATNLTVLQLELACITKLIKTQSMDKEKLRIFLGQLIDLQVMFKNMKTSGLSWDNVQEIQDNLRCIIIDLENSLD